MTERERKTLNKPFFEWDKQDIRFEGRDKGELIEKLADESKLVRETEEVLRGVARTFTDLGPR